MRMFLLGPALAVAIIGLAPYATDDMAPLVCRQLDLGYTPDQVTAQLHQGDPRFNDLRAPQTVWDAIIEQCDGG